MGNTSTLPDTSLRLVLVNSSSTARSMLQDAEEVDAYLDTCFHDTRNRMARHERTYVPNVFSEDDHSFFQSYLHTILSRLPLRLRKDLETVYVIPLMPSAEGGMPHTRPMNLICVPQIRSLITLSTMIHELWHVHQRLYRTQWDAIFLRMGWKEWSGHLPIALERARRYNPDTIDTPLWIYKDTWVPFPIFDHLTQPHIRHVHIWFYHVGNEQHIKHIPQDLHVLAPDLPESAWEHPREIAAYLLSDPKTHIDSVFLKQLIEDMGNISVSF